MTREIESSRRHIHEREQAAAKAENVEREKRTLESDLEKERGVK
jgi:hypothetical protein